MIRQSRRKVNVISKVFIRKAPARPVAKVSELALDISLGTTQVSQTLRTSTMAETFVGGNIQGNVVHLLEPSRVSMALVIRKDGTAVPALSTTSGAKLVSPEEWMLWGFVSAGQIDTNNRFNDRIKTMRKLKEGDSIMLLMLGSATDIGLVIAHFIGFFKQ